MGKKQSKSEVNHWQERRKLWEATCVGNHSNNSKTKTAFHEALCFPCSLQHPCEFVVLLSSPYFIEEETHVHN